jgi:release factor glutamine methyltransferase
MKNEVVTVKIIFDAFKNTLSSHYQETEIIQFVYILFEEWVGWSKTDVHLNLQKTVEGEKAEQFWDALVRLERNEPVQYIIGYTYFLDLKIKVRPGILIPRPETAELVSMILQDIQHRQYENLSILDIGTGSGCIPIAIKKKFPCMDVSTLDISADNLSNAAVNAQMNDCTLNFIADDILHHENWSRYPGYEIIVSNPPYVTQSEAALMHPNVLEFEPHMALFVSDADPLKFYQAIGEFAFSHLIRPGKLYLEINERFGGEICKLLGSTGFDRSEVFKDIHGKDRFIRAEVKSTMLDTSYWNVEH